MGTLRTSPPHAETGLLLAVLLGLTLTWASPALGYDVLVPLPEGRSLSGVPSATEQRTLSSHIHHRFTAPSGREIAVLKLDGGSGERAFSALDSAGLDYTVDYPRRRLSYQPDDPLVKGPFPISELDFTVPYHLSLTGAFSAWDQWRSAESVTTAVLDSGFDTSHPDLRDNLWTNPAERDGVPGADDDGNGYTDDLHGYDFVAGDADLRKIDPRTGISHGTAVAGLIGARGDNGEGIAALAGGVNGAEGSPLMLLAVVDADGTIPLAAELEAVTYALDHGAEVINLSFGGSDLKQLEREELRAASEQALIVAAAGNYRREQGESPGPVDAPARYDSVVSVGATELFAIHPGNFGERLADYSRHDPDGAQIEITAPGSSMLTTAWDGRYHRPGVGPPLNALEGTSFSTPLVSAAAALIWHNTDPEGPEEVREQLHELTLDLGQPGFDARFGHGRLDLSTRFRTPGDADGDGEVTAEDLEIVEGLYGERRGQVDFSDRADLNRDGVIDELDWLRVARQLDPELLEDDPDGGSDPEGNGNGGDSGRPSG